jgi:hypothetical protein
MSVGPDLWIRWATTGCVTRLPLIAGMVSYFIRICMISLRPAGPARSSLREFRWE